MALISSSSLNTPSRVGGLNNQRASQPRSPLRKVILAQGEQDDYLARLRRVAE